MEELSDYLKKKETSIKNTHLHSELHLLVDEARNLFGETATKGKGSFSFYLGFFKRLGVQKVRQLLSEVKQSNASEPDKLFWYLVGKEGKK
jgi:hypothetical protein